MQMMKDMSGDSAALSSHLPTVPARTATAAAAKHAPPYTLLPPTAARSPKRRKRDCDKPKEPSKGTNPTAAGLGGGVSALALLHGGCTAVLEGSVRHRRQCQSDWVRQVQREMVRYREVECAHSEAMHVTRLFHFAPSLLASSLTLRGSLCVGIQACRVVKEEAAVSGEAAAAGSAAEDKPWSPSDIHSLPLFWSILWSGLERDGWALQRGPAAEWYCCWLLCCC